MSNEVVLSDIKQRLTDQIKGQFAAMIPNDEWQSLIETQTNKFMEVEFPNIVKECLKEKLTAVIKEQFSEPRWQDHWNGYYNQPSEAISKLIREHSGVIVEALVGQLVNGAVQQMRNQSTY